MNASTLFDLEAVQAVAARYGTSLVKLAADSFDPDVEGWDLPLYLTDVTVQEIGAYRIEVVWDVESKSWAIMPYLDHNWLYTATGADHVIEVFKQAVALTNELNAL